MACGNSFTLLSASLLILSVMKRLLTKSQMIIMTSKSLQEMYSSRHDKQRMCSNVNFSINTHPIIMFRTIFIKFRSRAIRNCPSLLNSSKYWPPQSHLKMSSWLQNIWPRNLELILNHILTQWKLHVRTILIQPPTSWGSDVFKTGILYKNW